MSVLPSELGPDSHASDFLLTILLSHGNSDANLASPQVGGFSGRKPVSGSELGSAFRSAVVRRKAWKRDVCGFGVEGYME